MARRRRQRQRKGYRNNTQSCPASHPKNTNFQILQKTLLTADGVAKDSYYYHRKDSFLTFLTTQTLQKDSYQQTRPLVRALIAASPVPISSILGR